MAWSRKALNLISALHRMSGLGVRPAWYSRRNSANTRSRYSAAKLTCSISMPITSATAAASTKSMLDEQYSLSSSSSQFFMKMPMTSYPCCLSRYAVTAESTPPSIRRRCCWAVIGGFYGKGFRNDGLVEVLHAGLIA
jgi:hypothetical protein